MSANLDALRQAVSFSPDNVPLLLLLGEGCLDHFLIDEARQHFQVALTREPLNVGAQLGLARAAYQEGNLSQAVVRAEAISRNHPQNGGVWRLLSRLAFIEGHVAEAREHYARARQVEPSMRDEGLEKDLAEKQPPPPPARGETNRPIPAGPETDEDKPSFDDDSKDQGPKLGLIPDLSVEFEKPTVKFADVGGMNAVKEDIRMKIIYPLQNAELFRQYGKKTGGGVLLYGPPGCGKTLLARATAGEIKATFLSIGIHQVLDMWLGNSEKNLHKIFELARQNTPAILFFDEVDALASDRASMKQSAGRNVINQFLAEMDGAIGDNEGILVLGATNAPWQVDSAFRRPGRFDRVLFVPPPDEDARASIIEIMAQGKPVVKLDARAVAKRTKDFSGADLKAVFDLATEEKLAIAMRENRLVPISTDDLINAAKKMQPSTRAWFESAKNYALYANQSGFYNDVLAFLGIKKMSTEQAFHANLRRGQLLRQTGRYEEACEYLSAAIHLDPERPEPYLELSLAQDEMPGKRAEALRSIDRAIALDPESDMYLGYKGLLLSRCGRHVEGLEFARRAQEICPWSPVGLMAEAHIHMRMNEWVKAEEIARRLLELDAEDTSALNILAESLRFQHRYPASRVVLDQLLARVPDDALGHATFGYQALAVGDYHRANEHFLNALRLEPKLRYARQGLLQSLRHRVWIYRMNQKMYHLISGGPHHGRGFRLALILLTIGTGGLFLGVILFFAFIGMTIQPISDFFLLFDPMGRRALTVLERRSSIFVGAVTAFFLVLIAYSGFPHLVMGIACYLTIFTLCVLIPQWTDAWRARRESKLLAQEAPT